MEGIKIQSYRMLNVGSHGSEIDPSKLSSLMAENVVVLSDPRDVVDYSTSMPLNVSEANSLFYVYSFGSSEIDP
jgi:hypothetical protein